MFTLDDPGCIPGHIVETLRENRHILERVRYFDHLLDTPSLNAAATELDALVSASHVRGYHCTKELTPGTFASTGLRTLALEHHISKVLTLVRGTAPDLLNDFRAALGRRRAEYDIQFREGRICFCLTRELVADGTEDFFTYYGGEVVYRAFPPKHRCRTFLESLGRPVVVEVSLSASHLVVFSKLPFARALFGRYAITINPAFQPEDVEGHLVSPVDASDIIQVHDKHAFFAAGVSSAG